MKRLFIRDDILPICCEENKFLCLCLEAPETNELVKE